MTSNSFCISSRTMETRSPSAHVSDGFQMAEVLNEYFSSVFTTEDISSLLVPFTKFEGNKSEHLRQLFVTPEIIAKKIKKMKDNKSPGVDRIPLKLLKEIVEQISTPLAKLFNLKKKEFRMERSKHYAAI